MSTPVLNILKHMLFVLSTGYVFVYFSEHLFWARMRPDDSLPGWFGAWVAYALLAYVFLGLVSYFRVKGIWPLFLAGAVFGWLAEGVVVQTTYDMLPMSISFTGLAWHAMLTVWVGWYAVQRALQSPRVWPSLLLCSLIGLAFGVWAISWWVEPDGGVAPVPEFAAFAFTTTGLVMLAYWLANWSSSTPMRWNRWVTILVTALFVLYFVVVTVPARPIALLVLPILLGLAFWGLRQNRLAENEGSLQETLYGRAPWRNYLGLLCIPVTGTLVYALAMSMNLQVPTNWALYLVTTPLGSVLFVISLVKTQRRARFSLARAG